ncbi:hypothetical protein MKX01_042463 [Papaver californicum]|nr:hypothetical protein MKX01_042463 [Papaver californicum]
MKKIHALVLPFPAQGHVIPLMKLSYHLSEHGFKITFVNTEYNHERVVASLPKESNSKENNIHLVSIPDGREPAANRRDFAKVFDSILSSMPSYLEVLIREINESSDDKITCVIADEHMGWAVRVVKKMKIPVAGFWTAAAGLRTIHLHLKQMIETGILNSDGLPTKQQMIHLSPDMPAINTEHFAWNCTGDGIVQQSMFIFHQMLEI